ncbi:uncharacterized protein At5g23160 [Morus notabilis]|uniref:uncharacterized protein At5g23160 n=1 Tax=Morus notabilis TaxID=981085 RepID=UPI000CED05E3|nr:uncharacterized protein At5g23160 [Morus notabilis]
MAKVQNKTQHDRSKRKTSSSSSSSFLCCFGFSGKNFPEKQSEKDTIMISPSDHHHDGYDQKKAVTSVRFSCWPRLRVKSPSGVKTVPVLDATVPEKPPKDGKINSSPKPKSKSKSKPEKVPSKRQAPTTNSQLPNEIEIVVPVVSDPGPKQKPPEKNYQIKYGSAKNSNLDNRKRNSSPSHPSKDDTCYIQKRLSFSRKIEPTRAGSSQPSSPVQAKPKPGRTIRHSNSFAAGPNRDKSQVAQTKPGPTESNFARRFEPVVGMSIVLVTLVIMIVWGRLCAILCTSAWLYFVPRLSSAVDVGGVLGRPRGLDLGSEENKKKVVLDGFLERNNNHRCT